MEAEKSREWAPKDRDDIEKDNTPFVLSTSKDIPDIDLNESIAANPEKLRLLLEQDKDMQGINSHISNEKSLEKEMKQGRFISAWTTYREALLGTAGFSLTGVFAQGVRTGMMPNPGLYSVIRSVAATISMLPVAKKSLRHTGAREFAASACYGLSQVGWVLAFLHTDPAKLRSRMFFPHKSLRCR